MQSNIREWPKCTLAAASCLVLGAQVLVELKEGIWFSHKPLVSCKSNQLQHWVFLPAFRTLCVGQPPAPEEHQLYMRPCTSVLLSAPWPPQPEVSVEALLPVAAVWTRAQKGCSCYVTSVFTRACLDCVYSAFCRVKKKLFIADLSWSHLMVSLWAHFASNSIRTKNNSMDNLIADQ